MNLFTRPVRGCTGQKIITEGIGDKMSALSHHVEQIKTLLFGFYSLGLVTVCDSPQKDERDPRSMPSFK